MCKKISRRRSTFSECHPAGCVYITEQSRLRRLEARNQSLTTTSTPVITTINITEVTTRQARIADFAPAATTRCCHMANDGKPPIANTRLCACLGMAFPCGFWATVCKTVRPTLSDRCPVCLSVLSVTLVYCGQMLGWIKTKLGMHVGLGPCHTVLDGNPAPLPQGAQAPNFQPISVVAKWLDGPRCHLVGR